MLKELAPVDSVIAEFRTQIDAIDMELFALLKRRSQIVAQVGVHKRATQKARCFIRPGREADMTRALARADTAPFPLSHLFSIWRLLIAGSTNIEQTLTASVYATREQRDFIYLAREYFGPTTPIVSHPNCLRVIGDLLDQKTLIGFMPLPKDSEEAWWVHLTQPRAHTPRIFATAPLIADRSIPQALLIGDVVPEETGQDITWLVLDCPRDTSMARLNEAFTKTALRASGLAQAPSAQHSGNLAHLYEVQGFHMDGFAVKALSDLLGASVQTITPIGSYALPLSV